MLPGGFAVFEAGSCEGQILEVQGGEVVLDFGGGKITARQTLLRTAIESGGEAGFGEIPA